MTDIYIIVGASVESGRFGCSLSNFRAGELRAAVKREAISDGHVIAAIFEPA